MASNKYSLPELNSMAAIFGSFDTEAKKFIKKQKAKVWQTNNTPMHSKPSGTEQTNT